LFIKFNFSNHNFNGTIRLSLRKGVTVLALFGRAGVFLELTAKRSALKKCGYWLAVQRRSPEGPRWLRSFGAAAKYLIAAQRGSK
jgi:hypothetical protein